MFMPRCLEGTRQNGQPGEILRKHRLDRSLQPTGKKKHNAHKEPTVHLTYYRISFVSLLFLRQEHSEPHGRSRSGRFRLLAEGSSILRDPLAGFQHDCRWLAHVNVAIVVEGARQIQVAAVWTVDQQELLHILDDIFDALVGSACLGGRILSLQFKKDVRKLWIHYLHPNLHPILTYGFMEWKWFKFCEPILVLAVFCYFG